MKIQHVLFGASVAVGMFFALTSARADAKEKIEKGKTVTMHYTMSVDGKVVDTTRDSKPFTFVYGTDPMLPGLEKGVKGLEAGDETTLTLSPSEGFGKVNPQALVEVSKSQFREQKIEPGMWFTTQGQNGQPLRAVVKEVRDDTVVLDFNHPFAGKTVQFDVEILDVKKP